MKSMPGLSGSADNNCRADRFSVSFRPKTKRRDVMAYDKTIGELADAAAPDLIAIRRWIHRNPELGFEEFETAAMIGRELDALGIPWTGGIAKTGICALMEFGPGPCVAIRADMDALPIQETGTADYASTVAGKMHACGHDVHSSILLGVARVLRDLKPHNGKVMLIFQPAEETLNGARAMLEDGLFDHCEPDCVLGYHNWPLLEAGTVGWHPVASFSASDPFDITICGLSGHGAHPHLARDPMVAAGAILSGLQSLVSREVAPLSAATVTVGMINGGSARNQIPDRITLKGDIRTQSEEVRSALKKALERKVSGLAAGFGVEAAVDFLPGVPAVVNDPTLLSRVLNSVRQELGSDKVVELPQGSMGSEDFAEFSSRKPAAHLRIGSRHPGIDTMLHRSNFDVDEACIPGGAKAMAAAVLALLSDDPD